ncbi:MAG TPA: MCE family protein [Nocardioidaceae bacterium]|nr:MCE family protein [Nocardioidaceae bacterium]
MNIPTRSRVPSSAVKVTVFGVATLLVMGLLAMLIGNISFAPSRTYHGLFTDAVGVFKGDRVRLSGVEVGRVVGLEIVDDGPRRVARLDFTVEDDVPLYADARLELRYENIVGQRYLSIEQQPGDREQLADGATVPLEQTSPALSLTELFNGFQPLFRALEPEQVNAFSFQLVQALQGEAGSYAALARSAADLTGDIADRDALIGRVIDNLDALLGTVAERDDQLSALLVNFTSLMRGLAADKDVLDRAIPDLAGLLTGTAGLLRDVRPPLKDDLAALRRVVAALAADRAELDASLDRLPDKLRVLARTGSYGSWFNYYLCGLDLRLQLLDGTVNLTTARLPATESDTVCGGGYR